jgi:hypothetical protein
VVDNDDDIDNDNKDEIDSGDDDCDDGVDAFLI